jgi:hypothetical protein
MNPRLQSAGWWIVLGGVANSAWIFLWHYLQFPLTLVAMLILLVSLIIVYIRLEIGRTQVSNYEKWAVRVPFSIYLSWITVATVANVTSVLDDLKWDGFGLRPEVWMWIMLVVVLVLTIMMIFSRRDLAFLLVIVWALIGIAIKQAAIIQVAIPTWATIGCMILAFLLMALIKRPQQNKNIPSP